MAAAIANSAIQCNAEGGDSGLGIGFMFDFTRCYRARKFQRGWVRGILKCQPSSVFQRKANDKSRKAAEDHYSARQLCMGRSATSAGNLPCEGGDMVAHVDCASSSRSYCHVLSSGPESLNEVSVRR